jgi:hypothetical protein
MNLTSEIQTDWKRYQKTLPSVDLLFPSVFVFDMVTPLQFAHLVAIILGDFL